MKSRIITAPQQILSYGLDEVQCKIIDSIVNSIGMEHKIIAKEKANEKVGYLCGFRGFQAPRETVKILPKSNVLFFREFREKTLTGF